MTFRCQSVCSLFVLWTLVFSTAQSGVAQEKSVRPGINKLFENPDMKKILGIFEAESREIFDKRKEIVAACKIKPGMVVADIGACTGLFTRLFAKAVGERGHVFTVDISQKLIGHIEKTCKEQKIKNVTGVVATAKSSMLPRKSIDIAFICDTYHHFEYPLQTMESINRALRPGGKIIVIDFHRIKGKSREWVMDHVRAGQEVFTREIESCGFKRIEVRTDLLKENYFLRFKKVRDRPAREAFRVRTWYSGRDKNGFIVHEIESEFQAGPTKVFVLPPDNLEDNKRYPVIYVLPVESGLGGRWGNGLIEIQKLDLHNKLGVIFVMPTFSHLPWYCDHPTNKSIRQEAYFLQVVVPLIEISYLVILQPRGRLLIGFSKSGWGAFTLLLRNPDIFGRAAAWDAPVAMTAPNRFGMGPIFGSQKNFDSYAITVLLKKQLSSLKSEKRLALVGYSDFRKHHQQIHEQMKRLGIPHWYNDVSQGKHHWNSGWIADGVKVLLDNSGDGD